MKTALLLVLALCLSACGSRVRDWPDDALRPTDSVSVRTTVVAPVSNQEETPTTAAASRSVTTAATPSGTAVASSIAAPPPGRYTYDDVDNYPKTEDDPASTEKSVETVTWRVTRNPTAVMADIVDDAGGSSYTEHYRATATAFDLLGTTYVDEDGTVNCTFSSPQRLLTLPLKVGAQWHSDSSCTDDGYVDRTVDDVTVIGTATDTIGGKSVATFIVKTTETYTETDPEDPTDVYTEHITRTAHVDPTTLLVVKEDTVDTDEDGTITSTRTMRSLTPA